MLVLLDLAGVSSFGRLRRGASLDASWLEIVRLDGIRSCTSIFFSDGLASGGSGADLYYLLPSSDVSPMIKLEAENFMEARIQGLVMVVQVFAAMEVASCFGTCSSDMQVGAIPSENFEDLPFRVKI
jgi:hypothetical protein